MSPEPEKALAACDTLLNLVPESGHLVHMPSHIYILCGQYDKALAANVQATVVDSKFAAYNSSLGMYTIYRLHNIHFQIYAAIFLSQYEAALRAAEDMITIIPPEALHHEHAYIVNYLEAFSGMKPHVYVRFGKWAEIIAEPLPADPDLYCVTTAMWQYAKGIAYAVTGDIDKALAQQELLKIAVGNVPQEREIFQNSCRDILAVAEAMLTGELEYRRQSYKVAFDYLQQAVELYDGLNYTEPWAWMQPPRHALGALLLEQGHVEEAEAVYRADLGLDDSLVRPSQHPDNIWSLHGYAECLQRLGRPEANEVQARLERVQTAVTVPIHASCFCRTVEHDNCCDESL